MNDSKAMIGTAIRMVEPDEAHRLMEAIDRALQGECGPTASTETLRMVNFGQRSTAFNSLALHISRSLRDLAQCTSAATRAPQVRALLHVRERLAASAASGSFSALQPAHVDGPTTPSLDQAIATVYRITVGRSPVAEEIEIWKTNFGNGLPFHEFLLGMTGGDEALAHAGRKALLPSVSDGEFVQRAYELLLGRGAAAREIGGWLRQLERGLLSRTEVLVKLFESGTEFAEGLASAARHDGLSCLVMGTGTFLTAAQWQERAQALKTSAPPPAESRYRHRFAVHAEPRVKVSALASLYRGGDFIEQFMDNITGQEGFDEFCELIIVDADSPEDEFQTIRRHTGRHKNINYIRCNYRVGIYDAWNMAAQAAMGDYLTNTNLDDLRRSDSFAQQAGVLDNLPFVDVVYQDLYITFDPRLSFEEIAAFGYQTQLPVITPHNLIEFNSPHNAPMWRKRLHAELGYFDTHYRSAGDYEFWMRCLAAGKTFYKTNDPHVAYYQNPKGLSTRPDSRGVVEAMSIHKTYCRKLIPEEVVMPRAGLLDSLGLAPERGQGAEARDRYALAHEALRVAARLRKYAPAPVAGGFAP